MAYYHLIIPLLLAVVFALSIGGEKHKNYHWMIAFITAVVAFFILILDIPELLSEKVVVHYILGWQPPLGITFAVDWLNFTVVFLVIAVSIAALAICRTEIYEEKREFYALFMLLLLGLVGASITGDIFNLFVFFEILGIASYALVSYINKKGAVRSSIQYLLMGGFSTSLILLGIAFIYGSLGTLNMADISRNIGFSTIATFIGFGLLLCGFAFKAAIVPFHAWKPSVIKSTPLSVGLMFTAGSTMVGLYTIFRLIAISGADLSAMLVFLSMVTMVVGAVLALQTRDLKKLLAYSAISQSGYVLLGFGLGTYTGAVYHLVNLVIIDVLLFVGAYIVIKHFKTSDLDRMGGLAFSNPVLFVSFGIGVLALSGLPLFNGFSSKLLIYMAGIEVFIVSALVAMVVSVLTLAYSFKMFNMIFLSNRKNAGAVQLPCDLKWVLIITAVLCVVLGVFQGYFTDVFSAIAECGLDSGLYRQMVLGV